MSASFWGYSFVIADPSSGPEGYRFAGDPGCARRLVVAVPSGQMTVAVVWSPPSSRTTCAASAGDARSAVVSSTSVALHAPGSTGNDTSGTPATGPSGLASSRVSTLVSPSPRRGRMLLLSAEARADASGPFATTEATAGPTRPEAPGDAPAAPGG